MSFYPNSKQRRVMFSTLIYVLSVFGFHTLDKHFGFGDASPVASFLLCATVNGILLTLILRNAVAAQRNEIMLAEMTRGDRP